MSKENISAPGFVQGGGEMGAMIRAYPWETSVLGPIEGWPHSLRTVVGILLGSGYPMYVAWGREFVQIYNDAYRPILGSTKHPGALGESTQNTFREIWDFIGPMFLDVIGTGKASTFTDQLLPLDRHGYAEECYFTFSYSAVPGDDGAVGGVLVTVIETTDRMLRERRLATLRDLLQMPGREDLASICASSVEVLRRNRLDAPFALLYAFQPDGSGTLAGSAGLEPGGLYAPLRLEAAGEGPWRFAGLELAEPRLGALPTAIPEASPWPEPLVDFICVPVGAPGSARPQALLVLGKNSRLAFDREYQEFIRAVAINIGNAIAEAQARAHEKQRAEALAQIDRAKTVFFSDVSHEFRTPLTLMMGPIQEALAASEGAVRENLVIAERNTLRLLKLVNSLLDFSRIEAGRMQADFRPADLAALTIEMASHFRSAVEQAGLAFEVDCPPLQRAVAVDTDMWEKIVLNLLSNAFKHTFEGGIRVSLREEAGSAVLRVRDTGVGIPAQELAAVFDRFRRVPNTRARSHEGSGIGLAMVRELAQLHGGSVGVESRVDQGSTFTVRIPCEGAQANPLAPAAGSSAVGRPEAATRAFIEEAARWLPRATSAPIEAKAGPVGNARILVVDDNADMREYVKRLLASQWEVEACATGEEALRSVAGRRPDLVVTDLMMPGLDGFGLLANLRAREDTVRIPVILLSARAGEDARIEGLQAGAEDYIVKPFSARDLLARVENQLLRARIAAEKEHQSQVLASIFAQAPVAIAVLQGAEHRFVLANAHYGALVGNHRKLVGLTIREAFPDLADQGVYDLLDRVRATREPYVARSFRLVLQQPTGTHEGYFNFVYQPIVDARGEADQIAVVVHEVTELAVAKREAEAANSAKDEFVAMLGHELRNPLAPILTAIQLMKLRDASVHQREREVIERQVRHLVRLVDDLLDVSRVAQGKLALEVTRIEIAEVVAKAVEQVSPLLEQRRHQLLLDVPEVGLAVDADPQRLGQVVANLLNNAAKYTEPGGRIELIARRDAGEISVHVRDNGPGIEPANLEAVFEMFFQSRQGADRSQGGLGLGLAIVRSLVKLHGGRVVASSRGAGHGSEFVMTLPAANGAAPPAASPVGWESQSQMRRRVLVVDDNVDAGEMLATMLKMRGHEVRRTLDGPGALECVASFRPEIAFLDIGLPAMDGYELGRRLRGMPGLDSIVLCAITGYGQASDHARSHSAGFAMHLVKPVTLDQIEGVMRQAADRLEARAGGGAT